MTGVLATAWMAWRANRTLHADLIHQARLVAQAININHIKTLTGTETDLSSPDYQRLKEQLAAVRSADPQFRFLYLFGRMSDGRIFFFVDNEPAGSEDYSPPGQVFEEASEDLRRVFDTKIAFTEGPISDKWGVWVSALVPLSDPATGAVVAVMGMDIDARDWKKKVAAQAALPVALVLTILLLLTLLAIAQNRDIAERKRAEEVLRESEEWNKAILHTISSGVMVIECDTRKIIEVNDMALKLIGLPKEQVIGFICHKFVCPAEEKTCPILDLGMKVDFSEKILLSADGERKNIIKTVVPMQQHGRRYLIESFVDITERKQREEKIKVLLLEKELLLKEVHHRIKNNMSSMMSLLSLQANALKNPEAVAALLEARDRMRSMAMLYDKLYRSENLREMSLKDYLPLLINEIVGVFPNRDLVKVGKRIDDIVLGVKVLAPLGIIVNELITNARKHAFTGRESGSINVSASAKDGRVTLIVEDDGIGVPESIDIVNSPGFGLQLVGMLAAQLDGAVWIERGKGTRVVLEFAEG